jgi:hypothetical protein
MSTPPRSSVYPLGRHSLSSGLTVAPSALDALETVQAAPTPEATRIASLSLKTPSAALAFALWGSL